MRVSDLNEILLDGDNLNNGNECKKGMLTLFNEYKIVLESSFFELSIPFIVKK